MDVRPITAVEEVTELAGDVQIPVIDNGTLKRISKSNAKFGGGGGITTFTLIPPDASQQDDAGAKTFDGTVVNENGDEVTVEEAIATWENGLIRFVINYNGAGYELPSNVIVSSRRTGIQFYFSGLFNTQMRYSNVVIGNMSDK